jgi:hypothetical protein
MSDFPDRVAQPRAPALVRADQDHLPSRPVHYRRVKIKTYHPSFWISFSAAALPTLGCT